MSDDYRYSLLPGNASAFERAVERAFRELVSDIAPPFPALYQVGNTPAEFLPHLGADRGVGEWESSDPEQTKRDTVALAWRIKRLAGTRQALVHAIESLGYEATVTAWYEQTPPGAPYSFKVRSRTQDVFTEADFYRLERRLAEAKAERDTIEHTLAAETRAKVTAFVGTYSGADVTVYPYMTREGTVSGAFMLAVAAHSPSTVTAVYPDPSAVNPYQ